MKPPEIARGSVSRETAERLAAFVELLFRWNERINLISRADLASVWSRHIEDALQLVPLLPRADRAIDLGSGGGFPGLVLSIATGMHFDLVEADQRKAAFLREAIRGSRANATVHAVRAEAARIAPAPLITARAMASLPTLLALAAPLLRPDGVCVFPKGRMRANELTEAGREWHMRIERFPSRTEPAATILRISEIRRVGPER